MKPLVAVAIGDPSGVGPEICVKALSSGALDADTFVLVGALDPLEDAARAANVDVRFRPVRSVEEARGGDGIAVLEDPAFRRGAYTVGKPAAANGEATYRWMRTALGLAEQGAVQGLIIAPIDSTSLKLAQISTKREMDPGNVWLLRMTGKLRTIPIGEHVLMREVPAMVKKERVQHVIVLIGEAMRRWGFAQPKIAVAGLNPHCIGEEDRDEIAPAVEAARALGFDVTGPLSPDTIFRHGVSGRYDVIVTMYHDQGQIAVKTIGLEEACTIFVGLPYVRIGIPHGSAMDIAGTGTAQPGTAIQAMRTCASLAAGQGFA